LFNARPGIASDPTEPGLIKTSCGLLDPNPNPNDPNQKFVPRNCGRGPGQISVNLRLQKTFGFGAEKGESKSASGQGQSGGTPNPVLASGGLAIGNIIGTPKTRRRYNLTFGMSARNALNHTNAGPIIGNITSRFFGLANQMAGGLNGEGFSENADNRRLESQIRFQF
jgi:hypothetical protein